MSKSDRSRFETSIDTKLLCERLRKLDVGETATYTELSKCIGRDVQAKARNNLNSARRMLEREELTFDVVREVGIKRLAPTDAVDALRAHRERVRSAARRGVRAGDAIPLSELTMAKRVEWSTHMSHLGTLKALADDRHAKRIASAIDAHDPKQLAIANTLKAFSD